jgi:hypothetical protein
MWFRTPPIVEPISIVRLIVEAELFQATSPE